RPRGRLALVLLPASHVSAAHAHHAVRARQRRDQLVPARRPHRGDDQGRPRQRQRAAAVLHLRRGVQVLGHRVRLGPHDGAAGDPGRGGRGAVRVPGAADPLPVSRWLETAGAWLLGVLWILPLAYATWTAFHPREFSARFVPSAPGTLGT